MFYTMLPRVCDHQIFPTVSLKTSFGRDVVFEYECGGAIVRVERESDFQVCLEQACQVHVIFGACSVADQFSTPTGTLQTFPPKHIAISLWC